LRRGLLVFAAIRTVLKVVLRTLSIPTERRNNRAEGATRRAIIVLRGTARTGTVLSDVKKVLVRVDVNPLEWEK
jgi:hypothetical protein